jgi:hypothetical protein
MSLWITFIPNNLNFSSWQVEVPDDWLRYPMPWEVIDYDHPYN